MTRPGSSRGGPPAGIERRATPRQSYFADRDRARLFSILIHGCVIALLIFGVPDLFDAPATLEKPIAITLVDTPDVAPEPAPVPDTAAPGADAAAQEAAAAAPAPAPAEEPEPDSSQTALPYDPSFNPFAAPQAEIRENTPPPPQAAPAPAAPQNSNPATGKAQNADENIGNGEEASDAGEANGTSGMGLATPPAGSPSGDIKWKQQYLYIYTRAGNIGYKAELKRFLQQLISCGVVPIDSHNQGLTIEADIVFAPNGTIQFARLTNPGIFSVDPGYAQAAQQLMAAISRPSCAVVTLPPTDYRYWRSAHLSFFQRGPTLSNPP